jgi:hypothetical protein
MEQQTMKPIRYDIYDNKSRQIVATSNDGRRAMQMAERRNLQYGAHRYSRCVVWPDTQLQELTHA